MAQMMLGYVFPIAFEIADHYLRMMQIYAFTRCVNYYFGGIERGPSLQEKA